jgi:hypothetical protein
MLCTCILDSGEYATLVNKGDNIRVLGAISVHGILSLCVRLPKASKKRKLTNTIKTVGGGTKTEHYMYMYINFLNRLMDEMDGNGMEGYNLIMDTAPIHRTKGIDRETRIQPGLLVSIFSVP